MSTISSPIPTSCFIDTILVPLPVWLALATIPILFLLNLRSRKNNYNPSTTHLRAKQTRTCGQRTLSAIYYILIVANILMQVLEIVRLELISFGIGLLPFVILGLIVGAYLHFSNGVSERIRYWMVVNCILWVGGVVMSVVKTVGLAYEGIHERKGGKYPMADQVTDTAVMAGVYAVILILEILLRDNHARRASDEMSLGSGRSPPASRKAWLGRN